jgi:hypothetical protein
MLPQRCEGSVWPAGCDLRHRTASPVFVGRRTGILTVSQWANRGGAHVAAGAELLPLAPTAPLLDNGGRGGAGRSLPLCFGAGGGARHSGRPLHQGRSLALGQICKIFRLDFNLDPQRDDPISIARGEFDAAYDELKAAGVLVRADRDAAWQDFAHWRANYDDVLVSLAMLVGAPCAPWSSDRGVVRHRPSLLRAMIGH